MPQSWFVDMEQRFIFKANYSVNSKVELSPVGETVVAFGPEGTNPNVGLDGSPLCLISPARRAPWMASFKFGYPTRLALSGIFSTPNPESLCVVAGGFGYWIDVVQQTKSDIKCFPIRQAHICEKPDLIVFADCTRLAAYDANGLKWRTDRLVLDDLFIVDGDISVLTCEGLDAAAAATVQFKVDLLSGLKL
ncbi:MAG: hypothetical protein WCE73_19080 [Candidatus Angelobacter sp.]